MRPWHSAALIAALSSTIPSQNVPDIAFLDVNVVPMDAERVLEHQTVIVRNRRIVAMGTSSEIRVPEGATRIDGGGKYLMPGLAEMHGHLPLPSRAYPDRWPDDVLFLYVANGITTVRGMQGRPQHIEMRSRLESGDLLGPRIYVAGPPLSGAVSSAEEGERRVRQYAEAGYDLLKIHERITPEVYDAIASTAKELSIDFAGHVPDEVGFFGAVQAGQITVDHLDNMYDAVEGNVNRIDELVEVLRRHSAWVVPTEVLWQTAFLAPGDPAALRRERPEIRYVPRSMVEQWSRRLEGTRAAGVDPSGEDRIAFRLQLIAAIDNAGVGLLLGTDSPQIFSVPGFCLHREIQVMVEAGMSPYQVLSAGTRRVAEYFGTEGSTGTVAVGKRADLLLLNGNPLEDARVSDRAGVMVNGRWLSADEIQRRLAEIAEAYSGN